MVAVWVVALWANVDDWYADRISYEVFSARQSLIWRGIEGTDAHEPGTLAGVNAALRDSLRRHMTPTERWLTAFSRAAGADDAARRCLAAASQARTLDEAIAAVRAIAGENMAAYLAALSSAVSRPAE